MDVQCIKNQNKNYNFIFLITNYCNIKCCGCTVGCDIRPQEENWYLSPEDFRKNLQILKKITNYTFDIDFSGGEPLLHPNFLELCEIAKQEMPNSKIRIWTNGKKITDFSDEELIQYIKKYNLHFFLSVYGNEKLLKNYQYNKKRFQKIKYPNNLFLQGSRIDFSYLTYNNFYYPENSNKKKERDINFIIKKFQTCNRFEEKQLFIYKNKMFGCYQAPFIVELDKNLKFKTTDYIDLNKITNEQQILDYFSIPKHMCLYCPCDGNNDQILWNNFFSKRNITQNLSELYINDYKSYYQLFNNDEIKNNIKHCLLNSDFVQHLIIEDQYDHFQQTYTRFINGILDCFIFFDKNTSIDIVKKIYSFFKNQDTNKQSNYYICCINCTSEQEKEIYEIFQPFKKNGLTGWFYKSNNFLEGYNLLYKNSYSKNIYILNLTEKINSQKQLNYLKNNIHYLRHSVNNCRPDNFMIHQRKKYEI